jgi:hypothetical protein
LVCKEQKGFHGMNIDRFDNLTRRFVSRGGSRRTLLRLTAFLALPGLQVLSSPPARAAEVDDAQCPSGTFSSYERTVIAQTFKALHTGRMTRATVYAVAPSATNGDNYHIGIYTTTRKGKPTKKELAGKIVSEIVRPPAGQTTEVTVNFTPGARVKKGERYALMIQGIGSTVPSLLTNRPSGQATPDCPGTLFDFVDNTFVKDTSTDLVFATVLTKA